MPLVRHRRQKKCEPFIMEGVTFFGRRQVTNGRR
jgi:hypothetical protein